MKPLTFGNFHEMVHELKHPITLGYVVMLKDEIIEEFPPNHFMSAYQTYELHQECEGLLELWELRCYYWPKHNKFSDRDWVRIRDHNKFTI